MFSIIIPLYNKAAYIEKALLSVQAQSFQEFEVIVINDGSTDNSFDKIQKFKSSKVQIVEQVNCGVSTTRNNGVKYAKYDYIAFLDADDWWSPDYLENMKQLIEKYPEAGIYASSYYKVKYGKTTPAKIGVNEGFQDGLINYYQVYAKTLWMPIWTGATIIKREVFEQLGGFKTKLKLGEDFDLWTRVAESYPIAFLNKPLAFYNQDVDVNRRAVGTKLYEPDEHVLFNDYNRLILENNDFRLLYEKLALYGFIPYYVKKKNLNEIRKILKIINWNNHPFKYRLIYKILPGFVFRLFFFMRHKGSFIKSNLLKMNARY